MYLMLSVAGSLTIFLTRTRGPFWSIRPARILVLAVLGAEPIATCWQLSGIFMPRLGWRWVLLVWGYAIAWFLLTDRVKLLAYRILDPVKDQGTAETHGTAHGGQPGARPGLAARPARGRGAHGGGGAVPSPVPDPATRCSTTAAPDTTKRKTMTSTEQFRIGAKASCSDGACGEVSRVIVDPIAEAVTHLVVEPGHRRDPGRLVPLGLIDATKGDIRLRCTRAEFAKLDPAEETQFIPRATSYPGYGPGQVSYWPYYGMGMGGKGFAGAGAGGTAGTGGYSQAVTFDSVPRGEVDVRRGDDVRATDGHIGRVQGLVIDRQSGHVTHVLLQEGHLWGRRQVAIPASAVTSNSDGIQLSISKQEVQDLPSVDVHHPGTLPDPAAAKPGE